MEHTGGDRIEGTVGDDARNIVTGKNIDQNVQEVNVPITINAPNWNPTISHGQDQRRLSLEIEQEFRQTFAKLTEALIELRESVKTNNALTKQQIDLLATQVDNVKKIAEGAESKVISSLSGINIVSTAAQPLLPRWVIVFGTVCLSLITIGMIAVVFLVAQGVG